MPGLCSPQDLFVESPSLTHAHGNTLSFKYWLSITSVTTSLTTLFNIVTPSLLSDAVAFAISLCIVLLHPYHLPGCYIFPFLTCLQSIFPH